MDELNTPDMRAEDGGFFHTARDGTRLFVVTQRAGHTRGTVVLTHGMGEHLGRYDHVAERLREAGCTVVRWDLRGHGRSDGRRGHVGSYAMLLDDLAEVCALAQAETGPLYLYGHSLGGQIVLNFATRDRPEAAGLIITSPWLRLVFAPARWRLVVAWLAARVWPTLTQATTLTQAMLSRDMDFLKAMRNLELVHHRMSARMYEELLKGAAEARRQAPALPYPMLLIHGAADPVTAVAETEGLFPRLISADKTLVIVPEALHETHNDLCREEVLGHITGWLEARLPDGA
jgi:alpha-beta hydrolase superfamily lysophospholipase